MEFNEIYNTGFGTQTFEAFEDDGLGKYTCTFQLFVSEHQKASHPRYESMAVLTYERLDRGGAITIEELFPLQTAFGLLLGADGKRVDPWMHIKNVMVPSVKAQYLAMVAP